MAATVTTTARRALLVLVVLEYLLKLVHDDLIVF